MPTKQPPHATARAIAEAQARRAREAEALRENLRRRKAQARDRAADTKPESEPPHARDA